MLLKATNPYFFKELHVNGAFFIYWHKMQLFQFLKDGLLLVEGSVYLFWGKKLVVWWCILIWLLASWKISNYDIKMAKKHAPCFLAVIKIFQHLWSIQGSFDWHVNYGYLLNFLKQMLPFFKKIPKFFFGMESNSFPSFPY